MKKKYLRHTSVAMFALRAFQSLFSLTLLVFAVHQTIVSIARGEAQVPLRGANIIVTTETPDWFLVVLLAWLVACALLAFVASLIVRQFVEALRN
jgi:multisubunit Na+/H+ antiporter MnhC subunit